MEAAQSTPIPTGQVPAVTLKLLTGGQEDGGRAAGVFTAEDLISLLLYVRTARRLPQDLDSFVKDLGSDNTGIPGLEPVDIVTLYQKVTDHANRWTPVEDLVKNQASVLTLAAQEIVSTGGAILKVINAMDIVDQLNSLGESGGTIVIATGKDKQIQASLPTVIEKLRKTCSDQQERTRAVLTAVRDYKTEISGGQLSNNTQVTGLEPAVADKKNRARAANLSEKIVALQSEIDALDPQIDQLKKDYDKYVGLAFTGAAGGPIGLAITGGIFGAKAEAVRKQRNELIDQKNQKAAELQRDQRIQGILNIFSTQFTDLGMRLLDAEQALMHLDFLWEDIITRIDHSVQKWAGVTDSTMLLSFVDDLNGVVTPWTGVGDMTSKLSKVFDQAYETFRRTYDTP